MTRTRRRTLTFKQPFTLGVKRQLPAGEYEPVTDDEVIEELSFPVSRRVAIWIMAPAAGSATATEMISIDPAEIAVAHERDRAFEA